MFGIWTALVGWTDIGEIQEKKAPTKSAAYGLKVAIVNKELTILQEGVVF